MSASADQKATLVGLLILALVVVGAELGRRSDRYVQKEQDMSLARKAAGTEPFMPKLMEAIEKKLRRFRFKLFLGAK